MGVGKRLQELRIAKGLSQGDIQRRTGILRQYLSRIENGHIAPSLETLDKLARALDVELYQLFFAGEGKPEAARVTPTMLNPRRGSEQDALLKVFGRMSKPNRSLLLAMARKMAATEKRK